MSTILPLEAAEGAARAEGAVIEREGRRWFEIRDVQLMRPFLMTLISDRDHWMFIASNGALTAGRRNPDRALFPYYTQDKILDMAGHAGSVTLIRVHAGDGEEPCLWPVFADGLARRQRIRRWLRKVELGTRIELEEEHRASGLALRVCWRPSARFGFVRQVTLENRGAETVSVDLVDGLQNLLCSGLEARFQNEFSILGDAYKRAEQVKDLPLAIYYLSSIPTDLARPMEALRATSAFAVGLEDASICLRADALDVFAERGTFAATQATRGLRPAFLLRKKLELEPGAEVSWYVVADVERNAAAVDELADALGNGRISAGDLEDDCALTEARLSRMISAADGFQLSGNERAVMRHVSNTVFNLMRGGALDGTYRFPRGDLARTARGFNREAAAELARLEESGAELDALFPWSGETAGLSRDALRLAREYLPLTFSRRHGDPSRPWNRFSIEIEDASGSPVYAYQGNWRDIFQNWETLMYSYPGYIMAAVSRFLNASSADGYNPYRVTKDGFEWEKPEPQDPWANIGYWGDHQIVYLLRLLEASDRFYPGRLREVLREHCFVYADIPYRIREYKDLVADPRDSIVYDEPRAKRIDERVKRLGADGKLLAAEDGAVVYVSLIEKLLVPLLAKIGNLVPEGGIWMNTQRPEWNDANNALVGYGVSVVTAAYCYRYAGFLLEMLDDSSVGETFELSSEVTQWLESLADVLQSEPESLSAGERGVMMRRLAERGDTFRARLYERGLSGARKGIQSESIRGFLQSARGWLGETLRSNRRSDGLYHSYNLLEFEGESVGVRHLYEMLEGQVAVLASGAVEPAEAVELLKSLRSSRLYRSDQNSYLLYPDRDLPGFMEKNRIPEGRVQRLKEHLEVLMLPGESVLVRLPSGGYAFEGGLRNSVDLALRLKALKGQHDLPEAVLDEVVRIYEETFRHREFTGRSGTFFAYEGLGSIYWHMVSKLALAVQELAIEAAHDTGIGAQSFSGLRAAYEDIRDGLGVSKPVAVHGAIPTDAYSHTPAQAGAQQPGMTGQVKEDILTRRAELGLLVEEGHIRFDPCLLPEGEWLEEDAVFRFDALDGEQLEMDVPSGAFAFSFCQVPVICRLCKDGEGQITIFDRDGGRTEVQGWNLPVEISREIFARSGRIVRLEVDYPGTSAAK